MSRPTIDERVLANVAPKAWSRAMHKPTIDERIQRLENCNDDKARDLRDLADRLSRCEECEPQGADLAAEDVSWDALREFMATACALGAWITDETEAAAVSAGLWSGPDEPTERECDSGTSRKLAVIADAASAAAQELREVDALSKVVKHG